MSDRPDTAGTDVLFVSASVGAGHNSASQAVMAGLAERRGDLSVALWDMMELAPRAFRAFYAGGYKKSMTCASWLWGVGYCLADRPHRRRRSMAERGRLAFERLMLRQFRCRLLTLGPRLVVNTHFLAPPEVGRLIGSGALNTKQFVVTTDMLAHRFWYADNVERYFVASGQSGEMIRSWGIDPQRICLSGIPIHPKWLAPLDRAKLLAEWRLPGDKQIVILAGGAQFTTGPVARMARDLVAAREDVFVVILTGHNNRLQAELDDLAGTHGRLRGIPMTDRAQELVELCSLMITKAGGITTSECAAKGKPMVFLRPVPGQEAGNARYYVEHGAGVMTSDWSQVVEATVRLLEEPERLAALAAGARKLYRPATQTIVDAIVEQLDHGGPD